MCYLLGEVTDLFLSFLPSLHPHHRQSYPPAPLPYLRQKGQLAGAQEARLLLHHPLILVAAVKDQFQQLEMEERTEEIVDGSWVGRGGHRHGGM
ncbi:hypothetical protein PVAP13_8NG025001 [Panicum virgatum]|uniref:Uncharacterized protein n=1 Tax=Panicum virgatum TaxID=38727 RepID=A0A8T0P4N6_PANVG|nr:hypothetical protein PVAP13_8NG025001 [Panicum virgatum]